MVSKKTVTIALILLFTLISCRLGKAVWEDGDFLVIRGTIKVYGNEPHTFLGIEADDGQLFYIHPDVQGLLRPRQNDRMVLKCRIYLGEIDSFESGFGFRETVIPVSWQ
jgi:hypothetical protein